MSTGFVLNIPQEMLNRLEDADKKIEKLAKTSEDAQTRIVSAFKSINTHGIDAFINKLTEAQTKLSQIGNTQINTSVNTAAFTGITSQVQNVIDEVNKIVPAIAKVKKAIGDTGMAKNPFAGIPESLKEWNNLQSQIDNVDAQIKKLTSTTMDFERQTQRLRSGQTTPITTSYNEYAYAKDKIAALQEEKKVYQEKQAEITKQNNALSEQVRIQESLKHFVMNQNSLPEQRKRQEYEAMRQMYIEDEKASEAAEKKKVKDAEKAEKERLKLRERRIREEEKAAERERKAYERAYKQLPTTINTKQAGQLVARSMDATSINQRLVAIKNLQAAVNNLDSTDKRYDQTVRKLNSEIQRQKDELKRLGVESDKVRSSHRGLMDISGQLARRLALVFSVSQITGYVKKLIEVRGEFELQQRSLQAILQNKDQANRIWQQTVDLAVRSPFRVKELVSYTKQLAAYRLESDKLFDTTKMLADVSAGLGVDMQRLILAYGQVRSAEFLRGTELRQLTEAGVPILEHLSQHFSELEGRAVSVGDVFDRISKRMVTFADVEGVFKKITSEGGTFYRMQEIQAETLQGQISNLKDSVDIMLNDIGKAYEGTLKNSVAFVRSLIVNWEVFADIIKTAAASFALYKLNLLAVTKAQIAHNIALQSNIKKEIIQRGVIKGLISAFKSLIPHIDRANASMANFGKANLWIIALSAVISSIVAIVRHTNQMNEALAEQDKAFNDSIVSLKKLEKQYKDVSKGADSFATKMKSLRELNTRLEDRNLKLSVSIEDVNTENIDKIFEENTKILEVAYQYGKEIGQALTRGINAAQGTVLGFSFFGENLKEDAEDYGASMAELMSWSMQEQMSSIEDSAMLNYQKMGKYAKQYFDSIKDGQRANESDYEWTKRRATALVMISKLEGDIVGKNKELQRALRSLVTDSIELGHETKSLFDRLAEGAGGLENLRKAAKENPIEMSAQIKTEVDKLDFDPASKQFIINDLHAMLNLQVNYVESNGEDPKKELDGWAKRVKEAVDAVNEEIKRKNKDIKDTDLFPVPQVGQTKEAYLNNAKAVIGIAKMTYDELQQIEDQELIDRTNALSPFVATFEKILNLYKAPKKTGGDKDTFTPMLRTVKEIYQEFKKLQSSFDDLTAKEGALAKFGDAFKEAFGKTPEQMGFDLFSEEGVKAAYDYLISKAPDAKKKIQAQLAKGEIVWDVKLQTKKEDDQELLDDIQELFDQYDLSLDLKKLNIPPDLAKSLFDVDYLDLNGLKKAVQDRSAEFIGTDMEKEYKKFLDKINDLSRKQREDEAKEFINFLKKNLDEVKLIQDKGAYNIALADRLFGKGKITAEQYMSSIRQIVEDTNKEVAKVNLDKFKDSATYIKAMGNLAAYSRDELEGMISALQGQVGANAGNMGADEIRAYYEALERLIDQYDKLESPFQKGEINDLIEYLGLQKQLNQEKEKEAALEQRKFVLNARLEGLQAKLASQQASGDAEGAKFTQGLIKSTVNELKEVDGKLVSVTSNISVISEKVANLGDGMVKALVVAQKVVNEIANVANAATKMFDDIKSTADALGADTESGGWAKAGYAMEMVGGVSSELTSGLANLASGNFAGALANVVGMVTKLVSGVAKIHDQDYQDIIETQAKEVERLGKAYEKLEQSTERAYSIEQLQKANAELERNVELQIASYKAMIAAENAKKNTDYEQIASWNGEIEALTQQWEELKQSLVEGVGGVSDYRSQTREFVDSWVSAFQETGDGLSGLKENFREFFDNIIAEQAALRVTEKFLAPFYESLNTALADLKLSVGESKDLREEADRIMPELSNALELIWNELGGSRGDADGGRLSALQKGIQGITESTAQVLEAIANSSRGYLASIDSKFSTLLASIGSGSEENPMLEQMRLVAKNTSAINTLLNSLVKGGHSQGGVGLKVFMN